MMIAATNHWRRGPRCLPGYPPKKRVTRAPPIFRGFASKNERDDDKNQQPPTPLRHLTDISVKGTGQVIFLNSDMSGKILLASLAIGDPFLASMAALGSFASSTSATYGILNKPATDHGLLSYNGCLVGCAASVFIAPDSVALATTATLFGASAATFVTASLSRALEDLPQWTLAFNLVTLTVLCRVQPLTAAAAAADEPVSSVVTDATTTTAEILASPLTGLSQIFVVNSAYTGLGIVAAIGSYSPHLAAHALMGSVIGSLTGYCCGAPVSEIADGLWGYNSALTSMGVAVFFVPTLQSRLLSVFGASSTAVVFGALQPVFGSIGCPALTLPFCAAMSGCWFLGSKYHWNATIPGLLLAADPHSPEKNDYAYKKK